MPTYDELVATIRALLATSALNEDEIEPADQVVVDAARELCS